MKYPPVDRRMSNTNGDRGCRRIRGVGGSRAFRPARGAEESAARPSERAQFAGLLIRARERGLVDRVLPLLQDARHHGYWLDDALIETVRQLTGE